MARPGSIALAGYYPMPEPLIPSCASILRWHSDSPTYLAPKGSIFDPCAGDGSAITQLRTAWADQTARSLDLTLKASEMETLRAQELASKLIRHDQSLCSDAFHLTWTGHATVLWINPPYDHDPDGGRLELKFLKRFTPALAPGDGYLYFIVPQSILADCADYLSRHYTHHRAWRFPEAHYDAFGQVVYVAKRAPRTLAPNSACHTLTTWAEFQNLDPLPQGCAEPFTVDGNRDFVLRRKTFDLNATLAGYQPSCHLPQIQRRGATDLLGAPSQTAVPPRAAHIALALASGVFNGLELEPDRPDLHPKLLVKGVFVRDLVEVEEKRNSKGELSGTVEVEQPKLVLTVLRLDTYEFIELKAGVHPTGNKDISGWNAADLLTFYQASLIDRLGDQFPPLHDPARTDHRLQLPQLARTPYTVQSSAIQAAIKLLATGKSPFLLADVGTGKSTMGYYIAAALSPEHHAATLAELARLGFETHRGHGPRRKPILPIVRSTLILCPPHLLGSWTDQVQACQPTARVQVLNELADLDAPADVYILSRERAKLGHAHRGLEGRCPGCGSPIETAAKANASRRLTCPAEHSEPSNVWAKLARDMATVIAPAFPESAYVLSAGVEPAFLAKLDEPRPLDAIKLETLIDRLLAMFREATGQRIASPSIHDYIDILSKLLPLTQRQTAIAAQLEDLAGAIPHYMRRTLHLVTTSLREHQAPTPDAADEVLGLLLGHATFTEPTVCGEQLFQAIPQPRRIPFAKHIARQHRHRFQLMLLDEAHEYANERSAQTRAALRLIALPGLRTVVLTGPLMDGYSSSLFVLFWALSPAFREQFAFGDLRRFVSLYGYSKVFVPRSDKATKLSYGSQSDRQIGPRRRLGEAPGILPTFLLEHLLPTSILVHKGDLDQELPPITETPVPLIPTSETDLQILGEYNNLLDELLRRIKADRFKKNRAGKLLGALLEVPSYLDRCTAECGPFTIAYPEALGGQRIAQGEQFPSNIRTLKETYLLRALSEAFERGDRAVVFLRHTRSYLPKRLLRIISEELTSSCFFLDAKRVSAKRREQYLNEHVIDPGVKVLIINPNCVRTGLNNLVAFSTAIWYETDYSSQTYLQANGRFHRIGQTRPVNILYPYWEGTAQEKAFKLIARKLTASLQVSGIDIRSALEAAGASEASNSLDTALAIGEALYRQLAA